MNTIPIAFQSGIFRKFEVIRGFVILSLISLVMIFPPVGMGQTPTPTPAPTATPAAVTAPNVLILYDSDGTFGWLGDMYSLRLTNLLSHFDAKVTRKSFSAYVQGDLAKYDATFYLGSVWNQEILPTVFQTDLSATTKTFVWLGVNLWRYAWDMSTYGPQQSFVDKYGFMLMQWSPDNHPTVTYKATVLKKDPYDMALSHFEVRDPLKAVVRATCQDASGISWPYAIQSGNAWFFADMPLVSTTFENRSLAFEDLLHDILASNHAENHRAYVRIEDISMGTPETELTAVRAKLTALKIPFMISLIPEYHDPLGVYNNGVPEILKIAKNNALAKEMLLWVKAGGQILQHGTTHNVDGLINPYTGVSGEDYEFYRVTADAIGALTIVGPLSNDSATWAKQRVLAGQKLIKNAGLTPVGWLTPHYLASDVDYKEFAKIYPFACDRSILFVKDSTGKTQALELNSPFIYTDTYGIKRIPESCGWIDLEGWLNLQPPILPADIIRNAQALKVVRDGVAGFYYHTYRDPALLEEVVTGFKAIGYTFVPLSGTMK
ncbi:MAG: DUF2334 domain-containing protein [Terrimicrobiaceae bacterium]